MTVRKTLALHAFYLTALMAVPAIGQDAGLRGSDEDFLRSTISTDVARPSVTPTPVPSPVRVRRRPVATPVYAPVERPVSEPLNRPIYRPDVTALPADPPRPVTSAEDNGATFFNPSGIRAGSFLWLPTLGLSGGYSTNGEGRAGSSPSYVYSIDPELIVRSQWSRHALDFTLRGSYDGYTTKGIYNRPSLDVGLRGRLDASTRTTVTVTSQYRFAHESLSSSEVPPGASQSAETHTYFGGAAVTYRPGRLGVTLGADTEREIYTGGDYASSNRDNQVVSSRLRLTYFGAGTLAPFLQGRLLARFYDDRVDDNGYRRDSTGYDLRGGLTIDFGPKLRGEIAGGYRVEMLEDERLENLEGVVFNTALTWSPRRLTTVTLFGDTSFSATSRAGASGSINYTGNLALRHSLGRNLEFNARAGATYTTYTGHDRKELTTNLFAGLTWALNRSVALNATYEYTGFKSSQSASDYLDNTVKLGILLRR